jgi:thymidylate synthase
MRQYLNLVRDVLRYGTKKPDRTGTGTIELFGPQVFYDLREGFPVLTTKFVHFHSVVSELLWMLRGSTNAKELEAVGVRIWSPWQREDGDLGPIYGRQWRTWEYVRSVDYGRETMGQIDQIAEALQLLKEDPHSRRNVISAWNVADLPKMALPPCHCLFQLHVDGQFLDLKLYQRSADVALGVPFNIASYALLLSMFAQECGYEPRLLIHSFGSCHIYLNHIEGLQQQLARQPLPLPRLVLAPKPVLAMQPGDIRLKEYQYHPGIKFEVAV